MAVQGVFAEPVLGPIIWNVHCRQWMISRRVKSASSKDEEMNTEHYNEAEASLLRPRP